MWCLTRRLLPFLAASIGVLAVCAPAGADFFAPETIQRFAPLLVIQKEEDNGPASARWFLTHSALRFSESAICSDETVYPGPWTAKATARLGQLVPRANRWHYRNKVSPFCHHSGATLFATDYTRPFDRNRAPGLNAIEGFYLAFNGSQAGMPFTEDPISHEFGTAAPVYYDDGELHRSGHAGRPRLAYITYWFFYAYNDAPPVPFLWNHQGDWEDMSLLFEQAPEGGDWTLRTVAYAAHGSPKSRTAVCAESVRASDPTACPAPRASWDDSLHLVGFVANGDHATYASPGLHPLHAGVNDHTSPIGSGFAWPTWRRLLPLESQPWAGFCGAWGNVGSSILGTGLAWAEDRTGPLGPGCLDDHQQQRKSGRPPAWGSSRSSSADREAKPGGAIAIGP